jgi:hypothetical protein
MKHTNATGMRRKGGLEMAEVAVAYRVEWTGCHLGIWWRPSFFSRPQISAITPSHNELCNLILSQMNNEVIGSLDTRRPRLIDPNDSTI